MAIFPAQLCQKSLSIAYVAPQAEGVAAYHLRHTYHHAKANCQRHVFAKCKAIVAKGEGNRRSGGDILLPIQVKTSADNPIKDNQKASLLANVEHVWRVVRRFKQA